MRVVPNPHIHETAVAGRGVSRQLERPGATVALGERKHDLLRRQMTRVHRSADADELAREPGSERPFERRAKCEPQRQRRRRTVADFDLVESRRTDPDGVAQLRLRQPPG